MPNAANPVRYAVEIEAALDRVLGADRDNPLHEWAAVALARSRGASLELVEGRLVAAGPGSLATLEQALRDIAVFYRCGVAEFRAMTAAERVAYLEQARAERGGFGWTHK